MAHEFEPHVGLCADSSQPGVCLWILSPSLSAPAQLILCLSQKIKKKKNEKKQTITSVDEDGEKPEPLVLC